MSKDIITQQAEKSKKLNELLSGLQNLYKDDVRRVVYLCYELGATTTQVADALGVERNTVSQLYPKKGKNGK